MKRGIIKRGTKRKSLSLTKTAAVTGVFCSAALIAAGLFFFGGRSYMFVSLGILLFSFLPFVMLFEGKKPRAREITVTSVMIAIAVAGRAAFFMLPQFKPMTAVVIIAGISLGGETGFVVGAMSALVSNMFVGQGPWTPWQMFALGVIGFISGVLFTDKGFERKKLLVGVYGFFSAFVLYGLIVDTSTVAMAVYELNLQTVLAVYIAGLPFNLIHGVSTFIFLMLIGNSMIRKLSRIKIKFGMKFSLPDK